MTCNDKCIHFPVCEQKKYDFANIDECQYYEEKRPHVEWKVIHNALGETKYQCNQCQHYVNFGDDKNFCPNCGASMISSNSKIKKSKSEIVPDYRDGWKLKEGDEK